MSKVTVFFVLAFYIIALIALGVALHDLWSVTGFFSFCISGFFFSLAIFTDQAFSDGNYSGYYFD